MTRVAGEANKKVSSRLTRRKPWNNTFTLIVPACCCNRAVNEPGSVSQRRNAPAATGAAHQKESRGIFFTTAQFLDQHYRINQFKNCVSTTRLPL